MEGGEIPDPEAKLLSLTDNDLEFYWPNLFRHGFTTHQIRQIVERLKKIDKSADLVLRSLDYAEWELEQGSMLDKDGNAVENPCSFVFNSLAKTGYYRRPKGYVSPEEQAEEDRKAQAEALKKKIEERERIEKEAREAKEREECKAWWESLGEEERRELEAQRKGPFEVWRLHYWKNHVKGGDG